MQVDLDVDAQVIVLEPLWNESELCKLIPGTRFKNKRWTLPATWASIVQLRGFFGTNLTFTDEFQTWTWTLYGNRVEPALRWREVLDVDARDDYESRLYPFQRAGVSFMLLAGSGLLGDELGVGKTITTLAFIRELELARNVDEGEGGLPALVVCLNSAKYHWSGRAAEWLDGIATPYVIDGGTAKGRKVIKEAREDPSALIVVNYESVRAFSRLAPYGSVKLKRCRECDPKFGDDIRTSQCQVHLKELNDVPFRTVVVDEAHRIGEPKTQQTRAVWALAHGPTVRHRWALTGTPDNVTRLWSIMHTVSPDEYPTRSKWMDRYALVAWNAFGGTDVVGLRPDTRDELYRYLDPRFRRTLIDVVLPQLPAKVREVRYATMPAAQRRAYDELNKQLVTRLPDGQLFIAQNRLVSKTRLMQFAAGSIKVEKLDLDDVGTWQVSIEAPSPKLDVLDEVLDELGDSTPFVVACVHRDLVFMAAERLAQRGIRHALVMGGVHPAEQQRATDELKSGDVRAIVFTIESGNASLDMSGAPVMIRLQRSWSLIQNVQTEGRVRRIGSERHGVIRIIDVVTEDTIEQHQIDRLIDKLNQLDEITRDRARLQQQLAGIVDPTAEPERVLALAHQLQELNDRRDRVLSNDDLDVMLAQEDDAA